VKVLLALIGGLESFSQTNLQLAHLLVLFQQVFVVLALALGGLTTC